jgi:hypothetical protein
MEQARILTAVADVDESPLAHARRHRQLTIDEAARRASVSPEEVQWLEEGRLYRFATPDRAAAESALPAPWSVKVEVLNGSGDIVYTRSVASRIQALSYRVVHVGRASSFDYLQTAVYFPPGGEAVCTHLARQLGAPVQPLPGGDDPRRCVVVVGPERAPGS